MRWQSGSGPLRASRGSRSRSGSYGTVFQVTYGGQILAAKRLDVSKHSSDNMERSEVENGLVREFRALQKVSHPCIVQLLGVVLDNPDWVCLLMELADLGSLRQVLDTRPQMIVPKQLVQIMIAYDIASALAYCHSLTPEPLLHHDIKSANVLLFAAGDTSSGDDLTDCSGSMLTAKVSDFGLAVGVSGTSTAAATSRSKTGAAGGTLAYRAPETFGGKYTTASEVYSYSMVLWEILTGDKPWHRDADGRPYMEVNVMNLVVNRRKRPEMAAAPGGSSTRSTALVALMRRCWTHTAKRRPPFDAIVAQLKPLLPQRSGNQKKLENEVLKLKAQVSSSMSDLREQVDLHVQSSGVPSASLFSSLFSSTSRGAPEATEPLPDVFISFRFGEAHVEALALKAALEATGLRVFLSDVAPGDNLGHIIANALRGCRFAVLLASKTYGRGTNDLFDTGREMQFVLSQKKPFYLVRMIPFGESWAEAETDLALPPSIMQKLWLPGTPMPDDLVSEMVVRMDKMSPRQLVFTESM